METIANWPSEYLEAGSVVALSYMAQSACDDKRAYKLLIANPIVAGTGLSIVGGVPGAPASGWLRAGPVWVAWVILAKGARLGDILPRTLKPCAGVTSTYELQVVNVMRRGGNALQIAAAKINDTFETHPGDVLGDALDNTLGFTVDTVFRAVLPIAIPLAIGFILYNAARK